MASKFCVHRCFVLRYGIAIAVVGVLFTGCGSSRTPSVEDRSYLKQVCLAYVNYSTVKDKPLESIEDLTPYFEGGTNYTDSGSYRDDGAKSRVVSGEYVVVLGLTVSFSDTNGKVVAYEKRTPKTGGFAVTDAAEVVWLDPAELEDRLLAGAEPGESTSGSGE